MVDSALSKIQDDINSNQPSALETLLKPSWDNQGLNSKTLQFGKYPYGAPRDSVQEYNPNMVEKARDLVADGYNWLGSGEREAYDKANKWINPNGMGAADFAPLAGDLIGLQDTSDMYSKARKSYDQGDILKAAGYGVGSATTGLLSLAGMAGTLFPLADKGIDAARVGVKNLTNKIDDPTTSALAGLDEAAENVPKKVPDFNKLIEMPDSVLSKIGAMPVSTVDRSHLRGAAGMVARPGDIDQVNNMNAIWDNPRKLIDKRILTAEDLYMRPYVSGMADVSRGGLERLVSVDGIDMDSVMFGGQNYMRQPHSGLWASEKDISKTILNAAGDAAKLDGAVGAPIFMPHQMAAAGSVDFSTHLTDVMSNWSKQNMSKSDKMLLDSRIRQGVPGKKGGWSSLSSPLPDFPGIDSPLLPEYLREIGGKRKMISKAIDEFRDRGAMSISQARSLIVDPTQTKPMIGNLQNVGVFGDSGLTQSYHPSYNANIDGSYLGSFDETPNIRNLNPLTRSGEPWLDNQIRRNEDPWRGDDGGNLLPRVSGSLNAGVIGLLKDPQIEYLIKIGAIKP